MKTYIIAEAGVNHNGRLNLAYNLINTAKKIKANCVKFQLFKHNHLTTKFAPQASYQKKILRKNRLNSNY